jgi:polysaccharide export outer membrane protein
MNRIRGSINLLIFFGLILALPVLVRGAEKPQKEYRVGPNDILEISVYQEDDLTKLARVSNSGKISYPLLGQVEVGGLTVEEVEEKIRVGLEADYLVNPQVTVFIKEYNAKKISVIGAVNKPGNYNIPQNRKLTLMEAIATAGGFSEVAAQNKIRIIRWEEGKKKNIEVNAKDITKEGNGSKDIDLKPDDIIFVPESFF